MEKKEQSGLEFIEDSEALKKEFFKAENFLEKNKKLLSYILGGVALLAALFYGYKYYIASQEKEAQTAMADAVFSFEADSLNQALKGQGGNEGLLSVADNYSSTKAGDLANLYAGIALMEQGKYQEAFSRLEKFNAEDQVLQAKAYALMGDAMIELKKPSDAVSHYQKAADYKPNQIATPGYLMKLALAYTESKDKKIAIETYSKIIESYGSSPEAYLAKKNKSRLESESGL